MLNVAFFGARGAAPATPGGSGRYGSHTACVAFEVPRRDPLLCDLGTGVGEWARQAALGTRSRPRALVLLSHGHADHVSGLRLLDSLPTGRPELDVHGPGSEGRRPDGVPGDLRYTCVEDEELMVHDARVTVRSVPHDGATNGYRIELAGVAVAYVGDHRAPVALDTVDPAVLELADGVDLLVHDAQHTAAEWESRRDGGHSTVDYALLVAREAGARRLALFHHDPARDDADLDRMVAGARRQGERMGADEVLAAAEGTTVSFERTERGDP